MTDTQPGQQLAGKRRGRAVLAAAVLGATFLSLPSSPATADPGGPGTVNNKRACVSAGVCRDLIGYNPQVRTIDCWWDTARGRHSYSRPIGECTSWPKTRMP